MLTLNMYLLTLSFIVHLFLIKGLINLRHSLYSSVVYKIYFHNAKYSKILQSVNTNYIYIYIYTYIIYILSLYWLYWLGVYWPQTGPVIAATLYVKKVRKTFGSRTQRKVALQKYSSDTDIFNKTMLLKPNLACLSACY